MGLLEKAKQKKARTSDDEEQPLNKTKKRQQPIHQTKTTKKVKDNNSPIEEYHIHTSEKTIEQQIRSNKNKYHYRLRYRIRILNKEPQN